MSQFKSNVKIKCDFWRNYYLHSSIHFTRVYGWKRQKQSSNWLRLHICPRTFTGDLGARGMTDQTLSHDTDLQYLRVHLLSPAPAPMPLLANSAAPRRHHVNRWSRKCAHAVNMLGEAFFYYELSTSALRRTLFWSYHGQRHRNKRLRLYAPFT